MLVKKELIRKGYRVWREGNKGYPDFKCWDGSKDFYVEVKSGHDGLRVNQLRVISNLLELGKKVYLYYCFNNKFEIFEINMTFSIMELSSAQNISFKCLNCISTNGYVRIETNEFVCRKCGSISKMDIPMKLHKKQRGKEEK